VPQCLSQITQHVLLLAKHASTGGPAAAGRGEIAQSVAMNTLPMAPGCVPNSHPIVCLDSNSSRYASRAVSGQLDYLGECSALSQKLPGPITTCARLASEPSQRVYIALSSYESGEPLGFLKVGQKALYLTVPAQAAFKRVPDPSSLVASLKAKTSVSGTTSRHIRSAKSLEGGTLLGGTGSLWECSPLCTLDFFVSERARRRGVGKALLDCMMRSEGVVHPAVLAYVRRVTDSVVCWEIHSSYLFPFGWRAIQTLFPRVVRPSSSSSLSPCTPRPPYYFFSATFRTVHPPCFSPF